MNPKYSTDMEEIESLKSENEALRALIQNIKEHAQEDDVLGHDANMGAILAMINLNKTIRTPAKG